MGCAADHEAIDRSPPELRPVGGDVGVNRGVGFFVIEVAVAGAEHGWIQATADRERCISQAFGIEPAGILSPEQPVAGIDRRCLCCPR